jgi:hypothetical protein
VYLNIVTFIRYTQSQNIVTFIRYTQSQNIGKTNNVRENVGARKPKRLIRIVKIS